MTPEAARLLYLVEERPTLTGFAEVLRHAMAPAGLLRHSIGVDASPIRELLSRIAALQAEGFVCDVGSTQSDPIAKARMSAPALIILDVTGYNRDVRRLQRDLKQDTVTSSIPLVILTDDSRQRSRIRAAAIGVQSYLVKPARPMQLHAELRRIGGLLAD